MLTNSMVSSIESQFVGFSTFPNGRLLQHRWADPSVALDEYEMNSSTVYCICQQQDKTRPIVAILSITYNERLI